MDKLLIENVKNAEGELRVAFNDGTRIAVPLDSFPRLAHATTAQRAKWRLVGRGLGVHWPQIDEDISVENILRAHSRQQMPKSHGDYLAPSQEMPLLRERDERYRIKRKPRSHSNS